MTLLTPIEFGRKYGIPLQRVYQFIKEGKLPVQRGEKNHSLIQEETVTSMQIEALKLTEPRYPNFIMEYVRQNLGVEEDDTSRDDEINNMLKKEVLARVLEWNGICGYTDDIIQWINDIYNINLEDYDE